MMGRKPRWKKGLRHKFHLGYRQSFHRSSVNSSQNIFGGVLCLMGVGMTLAVLPGWVYLFLLGGGIFAGGLLILQKGRLK